jgi:hypothetical protein
LKIVMILTLINFPPLSTFWIHAQAHIQWNLGQQVPPIWMHGVPTYEDCDSLNTFQEIHYDGLHSFLMACTANSNNPLKLLDVKSGTLLTPTMKMLNSIS